MARKLILNGGAIRPTGLLFIDQYSDGYHFVNSKNCTKINAPTFHVMSVNLSDIDKVYLNNKAMATLVKSISNPPVTL